MYRSRRINCQRCKAPLASTYLFGEQLPLPPPDGLPVVLGPFGGLHPPDLAMCFSPLQ